MKKPSEYFQTKTRDNGTRFVSKTDDCPDWLSDAIYESHDGMLPNDWVYATCRAACEAIEDGTINEDTGSHEFADGQVDVYTSERFEWAAQFCNSDLYACAEDDAKDLGIAKTTEEQLGVIQYCAIARIADLMRQVIEENQEKENK